MHGWILQQKLNGQTNRDLHKLKLTEWWRYRPNRLLDWFSLPTFSIFQKTQTKNQTKNGIEFETWYFLKIWLNINLLSFCLSESKIQSEICHCSVHYKLIIGVKRSITKEKGRREEKEWEKAYPKCLMIRNIQQHGIQFG